MSRASSHLKGRRQLQALATVLLWAGDLANQKRFIVRRLKFQGPCHIINLSMSMEIFIMIL